MKTIGLACDHAGFELKEYVRGWLEAKGWAYKDFCLLYTSGFIGGTPGSLQLWKDIKAGKIHAGGFDLNGKWVPLYNIHKTYEMCIRDRVYAHQEYCRFQGVGKSGIFDISDLLVLLVLFECFQL